jgi:hypothetical protein
LKLPSIEYMCILKLCICFIIFSFLILRALSNWKGKLDVLLDWYEQKLVQFEIFCRCKVHSFFFKVLWRGSDNKDRTHEQAGLK